MPQHFFQWLRIRVSYLHKMQEFPDCVERTCPFFWVLEMSQSFYLVTERIFYQQIWQLLLTCFIQAWAFPGAGFDLIWAVPEPEVHNLSLLARRFLKPLNEALIVFVVTWKVKECEGKFILNCSFREIVWIAFCIAREYCPEKSLPCPQLNALLWHKLANQCLPKPNKHLPIAFVSSSLKGRSCHEPAAAFQSNIPSSGAFKKKSQGQLSSSIFPSRYCRYGFPVTNKQVS